MSRARLGLIGAAGRMGRALLPRILAAPDLALAAAVTTADDPALGRDAGSLAGGEPVGVPLAAELDPHAVDLLVEFTLPHGFERWCTFATEHRKPLVSGTTGLDDHLQNQLRRAGEKIPILWAPNFSIGVNLLVALVERAAAQLPDTDWDAELTETHHRHKVDAPSGTALALIEAVRNGRNAPEAPPVFGRHGTTGARRPGEIGVHARRGGENPGEHEVTFAAAHEVVTLRHQLADRAALADGALRAARWLLPRAPGCYTMRDVLAG